MAIGSQILDVTACHDEGRFTGLAEEAADACTTPSLNALMALGSEYRTELRRQVSALLAADSPAWHANRRLGDRLLVSMADADMLLPAAIGDYTDFYASIHHATNIGSMFRPENPLLPNYKWVPIGYHGRASSIVPSGANIRRPEGQIKPPGADAPVFGPSRSLDYEMEIGCFIGQGNSLGEPIPLGQAGGHLFGLCLLNDWSARDIQSWEYQPLGPFLGKNFATTISPWVVTLEALEPFRIPASARPEGDPAPLPYLTDEGDRARGAADITVEVYLATAEMRARGIPAERLSRASVGNLYWTFAQLLTHHTSGGCNMRPGDLIASGTVSGPTRESRGSLMELAWRGTEPIPLPSGETRSFLQDGDELMMRGRCERAGAVSIGFGECVGTVLPAS
jgi:fumarylacetoacetase